MIRTISGIALADSTVSTAYAMLDPTPISDFLGDGYDVVTVDEDITVIPSLGAGDITYPAPNKMLKLKGFGDWCLCLVRNTTSNGYFNTFLYNPTTKKYFSSSASNTSSSTKHYKYIAIIYNDSTDEFIIFFRPTKTNVLTRAVRMCLGNNGIRYFSFGSSNSATSNTTGYTSTNDIVGQNLDGTYSRYRSSSCYDTGNIWADSDMRDYSVLMRQYVISQDGNDVITYFKNFVWDLIAKPLPVIPTRFYNKETGQFYVMATTGTGSNNYSSYGLIDTEE